MEDNSNNSPASNSNGSNRNGNNNKTATPKTNIKNKGPIRWEALLPATLIVVLIGLYFTLFFDSHLRKGIELGGFAALGAEVNVASVTSSFTKASLLIKGLEFTNSDKPTHNLLSIGTIEFGMSWDALLRGKILIEVAAIDQIQFDSQRRTRGRVKPPKPKKEGPSFLEREGQKLAQEALEKTKEEYSDNVLGDIAALLSGGSAQDQLKNIESQLKSKALMGQIESDFSGKRRQWDEKLKTLPQQKDLNAWNDRLKQIKSKDFKTPQEAQESLTQLQNLIREAEGRVKDVEKSGQELNADIKSVQAQLKELESAVQTDIKDLEARFKIPKLDAQAITRSLFVRYAGPYLNQFNKYQSMAHQYLPPGVLDKKKEGPEDVQIQPRPREYGVSYEFGKPNSYPFFWLKKARISSKATPGVPALGDLSGEALNVSSNQALTGRPMQFNLKGDFPELEILGIEAQLTMNHIQRPFRETFLAQIGSYPVGKKMLLDSKAVELGFSKAQGSTLIKAQYSDRMLEFSINNAYKQLDYVVSSSHKEMDGILKNIMSGIPIWTIDASGSGVFPNIPIDLRSNLGGEIAKGFEKVLKEKIAEAQAKVKTLVDEAIAKEKLKLETEVARAKSQVEGEIEKIKMALHKQKTELEAKIDETKKQQAQKLQKQLESEVKKQIGPDAEKKLDDLKKKLKF